MKQYGQFANYRKTKISFNVRALGAKYYQTFIKQRGSKNKGHDNWIVFSNLSSTSLGTAPESNKLLLAVLAFDQNCSRPKRSNVPSQLSLVRFQFNVIFLLLRCLRTQKERWRRRPQLSLLGRKFGFNMKKQT